MKTYFFLAFSLYSFLSFSQVGINTTSPDPSSILDVSATNKGMLLPRVALNGSGDNSTISNPAISLLVYNTSSNGGLTPGFYFWSGNKWNTISDTSGGGGGGNSDGWSLAGNSIDNSKFLGTTNYNALKLKVNNSQMALFDPHGGLAIGYGAVANENNSVAIGTNASASNSNQATAIGASATASGFQSAALGYNAKAITSNSTLALGNSSTASSFQATAIGVNSKATTSNNTLAVGTNSEATGENSSAIGQRAKAEAQNSTAIGNSSLAKNYNSTAIGNGAVASQNNAVVLGNITDANVGIGTSTPNINTKLDVNGNYKLGNKGSIQKNLMSFSKEMNFGTIQPNGSVILTINIPSDLQPSTVAASLIVTPDNSMSDDLSIAWSKLNGTQTVRIKLINTTSQTFNSPSHKFYISIIEFKEY
ncbi:hypothetical protein [Aequorivita sp. CIP111184]|uniref:hypothetical protein n=1 Tax=Aequorivita sp. CIP111184 TaxID=2211356 RepID=UPI0015ECD758|nr:hypothetical protein [Aequorivita sp. CIP111184]